jgi:peroxiredoxin
MSKGLQPGDVLPDFELPDEDGVMHKLSDLQGDNLMVLMLGRGEHCPRERQHQREMLRFHQWCPVAFTSLVTVLPNEAHDVFKLRSSTGATWPYLSDADLQVQKALDIHEYTDTHHDYATVPHTVILGPGLRVEKTYVGYWFWGRPSPEQLWVDLQELAMKVYDDFDPTVPEVRAKWESEQRASAA